MPAKRHDCWRALATEQGKFFRHLLQLYECDGSFSDRSVYLTCYWPFSALAVYLLCFNEKNRELPSLVKRPLPLPAAAAGHALVADVSYSAA